MDKGNLTKENIIKIEDLTFEYKREDDQETVLALDNVSIDITKGSFTAVIGRNGSGKSTLAKNINALLLPTKGVVYVEGYNTADDSAVWEIRQRAGMVFQNPDNQLVSAIVEDDVAFGPENLGIEPKEMKERVNDALASVKMTEFRKKAPHLLSGGQKQRVAIAGVVAMKPDIIVFDEPTAMLDPQGRKEVMKIIKRLHSEGITVLLITHFMEETIDSDRLIIMSKGKVAMDGKPIDIFKRSEELKKLDLELPFAVELSDRLRKKDIEIPDNSLRLEEIADYLCQ